MDTFIVVLLIGKSLYISVPNAPYKSPQHCIAAEQVWVDNNVNPKIPQGNDKYEVISCAQAIELEGHVVGNENVLYSLTKVTPEYGK